MMAMMAGLSKMMAPAMLGMAVGSMVGHLATRAFGTHDLPIPRQPATVTLVPSNIDGFATEWEIPVDEMRLWVLAHELAGHALFSVDAHPRRAGRPRAPARRRLPARPQRGGRRLGSLDGDSGDPMAALQQALGDPEVLLGAVTSPAQEALRPRLDALVAVVVGYIDWVVDAVAVRVVGGNALRIAEAVRRRRVETTASDSFVEQLLGIRLGDDQVARGKAFVQGVVDRAGDGGLRRCSSGPTPSRPRTRSTPPASGWPASSELTATRRRERPTARSWRRQRPTLRGAEAVQRTSAGRGSRRRRSRRAVDERAPAR